MSALGHYLEEEGIATVAISLIRPQTENTKPPRALWVPFELGRPFGPPGDPAFQKRVLLAALRLLERPDGKLIIEDFPDDDPRAQPDPSWQPPLPPAAPAEMTAARLETEIARLRRAYDRWVVQHGSSTVGLSGLPVAECGRIVAAWLNGERPASPRDGISPILLLRFAVDDLKAYYLEAAAAGAARPSSRQLGDWLWNATAAGAAIIALRALGLASDDERVKAVLGNLMVPAVRVA
ncbi:MAG: selenoprotein B, partial [Thiohalocapsa sp.]